MENYQKGEIKEVDEPPVFTLSSHDVHMRVAAGSKIRNVLGYAMKKIKETETRQICWSGSGKAISKTVSCAEIMKRKIKGLHQVTKIRTRRVEEYWEPMLEGLERLKVNRDIPAISILLSKDPLDREEPGYQAPGSFDEFWSDILLKDKVKLEKRETTNKNMDANKSSAANSRKRKRNNNKKNFSEKNENKQNNSGGPNKLGANNSSGNSKPGAVGQKT